ncbi:MAG: DUF1499 domain-containing protein [Deltaproteobacteria bacterium]|nr:DUF1499 domain-containing protein [Deltaproteobacteria bacterium]
MGEQFINEITDGPKRDFSIASVIGLTLAAVSMIAAIMSGLGTKLNWWEFRTGFSILKWGAYGGFIAVLISIVSLISSISGSRKSMFISIAALFIGLIVFYIPFQWWRNAQTLPPIHDITTDTENPPQFVKILEVRKDAPNPPWYGGAEVSLKQKAAYPDIGPLILPYEPLDAYERALRAAGRMGWQIVDADKKEGRIEATDSTFWFGFKDDIIVRIKPSATGSKIDVRSTSRVGKSDIGTNADRIRTYLDLLRSS